MALSLDGLVIDDADAQLFRVKRSTMTSDEILELEQRRVFDRCWLYIGHESEVAEPGDFRRRKVGGRQLMFVRGSDGEVRALYNSCTHRGARVCRQDAGNAKIFQCFYHAWTFNNRGELVGVPDAEGYGRGFDKAELGLRSVPRLASYRGFFFVAYDPAIEPLEDYLAGAKEYINLVVDQSPDGMAVVAGTHQYACQANWKLMVENSMDGYHGAPLHQTYFAYVATHGAVDAGKLKSKDARGFSLGNGHAVVDYPSPFPRATALWHPIFGEEARDDIDEIRREIYQRVGPERGYRMTETARNLFIYPNLLLLDVSGLTIRKIDPVRSDYMEITAWALAPKGETGPRLERRLDNFHLFLGPGGLATPDDVEALEACQEGFSATSDDYSDISRGMNREPSTVDEVQMRSFWREWYAQMLGSRHATHTEALRSGGTTTVSQ